MTFRYIDGVLSINNNNFHSYVDLIYTSEQEIEDTNGCSEFRKFYSQYTDLICPYKLSLGQILSDIFHDNINPFLYTDFDYVFPFTRFRLLAHIGCVRSTVDAYSSYAPNLTFGISGSPCLPCTHIFLIVYLRLRDLLRFVIFAFSYIYLVFSDVVSRFCSYSKVIKVHQSLEAKCSLNTELKRNM